jgi:hypothetical protein
MPARRDVLAAVLAGAAIALLRAARAAAPPTIEIIALSHWPVQNALKPVRDFLASLGARVKVVESDAESPAGEKRIAALGQKGHIPILLVINGSDVFKRTDGTAVLFKDFPAKADNPLGINGSWTVADFEAAVNAALGNASP